LPVPGTLWVIAQEQDRLLARQVVPGGQRQDLRGRKRTGLGEIELVKRLDLRKTRFLYSACNRFDPPLFQLRLKQCIEEVQVRVALTDRLLGQPLTT
jgi:hypothetical protein